MRRDSCAGPQELFRDSSAGSQRNSCMGPQESIRDSYAGPQELVRDSYAGPQRDSCTGPQVLIRDSPAGTSVADPNPDPSDSHVFGLPGSGSGSSSQRYGSGAGSFYHQAKIVRKTLIPTVLWLLFDFLSLKNDLNVPLKSNKQKTSQKISFLLAFWRLMTKIKGSWSRSGFFSQGHGSADPDPTKCHGSATLAGTQVPRRHSCVTPVKDFENSRCESRTTARQHALLICQKKFPHSSSFVGFWSDYILMPIRNHTATGSDLLFWCWSGSASKVKTRPV